MFSIPKDVEKFYLGLFTQFIIMHVISAGSPQFFAVCYLDVLYLCVLWLRVMSVYLGMAGAYGEDEVRSTGTIVTGDCEAPCGAGN